VPKKHYQVGKKGPRGPSGACRCCRLVREDPDKGARLEQALALGRTANDLSNEYGISRWIISRHWRVHVLNKREVLRSAHRLGEDAALQELMNASNLQPLAVCNRQIAIFRQDFDAARAKHDWEHMAETDRHLFDWTKLLHRIMQPLREQYGPQVSIQNNVMVANGAPDLGVLVGRAEAQLAGHPPEQRQQLITMLRDIAAPDAA
jgi:hypothetical protein